MKDAKREKSEGSAFFSPKKSLGQNFLQSQTALNQIIQAGELNSRDVVVEIGPGEGFLTKALVKRAGRIVALEKDEALAEKLRQEDWFKNNSEKIHLFSVDALKFDFPAFFQKEKIRSYKLIANIPYYITGKLLRIFQEIDCRPSLAVLLVQKEVAERICAPKGEKSLLSIAAEYFGVSRIMAVVDRKDFFPVPGVDSAILKIVFKKEEALPHQNLVQRKDFFRLVKWGFAARRKTLLNNLKGQYGKEETGAVLTELGLAKNVRAQELGLTDWLALEKFFGT